MAKDRFQLTNSINIEDIKDDFDRDGFIILRQYLSPAELSELRERTDRIAEISDKAILKNLNKQDAWFQEELVNGKHVALIERLIEDGLVPATAAWFSKPVGNSSVLKPHFDAIIHNALTVRWSGENHSNCSRRAVSYFYWGASSEILVPDDPVGQRLPTT